MTPKWREVGVSDFLDILLTKLLAWAEKRKYQNFLVSIRMVLWALSTAFVSYLVYKRIYM
ncbi:hypothetical protein D3227_18245 [Mesorhizobium waimense]|uniref:Uncharacterized protein n=1 Tax=Mesorhizobium waimense TaxID=1300307 RepID=A0A3A5KNQ5_9HYPH|nr:hypothetical protein D3227_18245 [Mesorhizobium waimense]